MGKTMIVVTAEQKESIQRIADAEIAKFITEIPHRVDQILTKSILSLLGLSAKFGGEYEVDHCNGRRSALIEAVERRTKEATDVLIGPIVSQAIVDVQNDKRFLAAVAKEAAHTYKQVLKYKIEDEAKKFAQAQANALFDGLKLELDGVVPTNTELEDPKSYDTKVGEILLEEVARKLTVEAAVTSQ